MVVRTGTIYSARGGSNSAYSAGSKKSPFQWLSGFLALLGRPVFYLIFYFVYFLLFIFSFLDQLILFFLKSLTKIKFPKIALPKLKLPRISLPRPRLTKRLIVPFAVLGLSTILGLASYLFIFKNLPNPHQLTTRDQIVTTKILDRSGKLLYKIYRRENRTLVKLGEIPPSLRQATIAIEDQEFYKHPGFSWRGIMRSLYRNLFRSRISGGSTITQQLVKNALLTPERTYLRKVKEIILALWVEMLYSKDEILQMYFNEVGYGGATYGIEEAAHFYFDKPLRDLTLAESAYLAGLPASPTRFSPFGANPELAKMRQEQVLRRMAEDKYITTEQVQQAFTQTILLAPQKTDIQAPHFVMYVKDLLVKKYGERLVEEGGLEVRTSLDLPTLKMAEKVVSEEIQKLTPLHISNGATLITNPKTGEILAMVGSKDYFDTAHDGNFNVTTALRQPGSAIKPVNYSVALGMGFTPATIIPDTPITYKIPGQPPYSPKNYDNRFHGNVPLRVALGSSYNVPAVKVLSAIGVSRMVEQGQKMGITTWNDPSRFGLSLTLGGGEVKMTDLAVVYGTLANLGVKVDLNPILEVKDYRGKVLEENECALENNHFQVQAARSTCLKTPVLNPHIAYLLTDILSDNAARTPAFGPNSLLVIPGKTVAVKTGTTQNLRDNWAVGYTPNYVVAAWVGNNDNTPMSWVASGITGASPIWNKIISSLLKDQSDEKFNSPENLIKVEICTLTGTLTCGACPGKKWELFLPGTEPKRACSEEEIKKILEERKTQTSTPRVE